jgi:hypothetical protein
VDLVKALTGDADVRALLQLHPYQNDLFFNRENFIWFCDWLTVQVLWGFYRSPEKGPAAGHPPAAEFVDFMNYLPALAEQAKYKLEVLLKKLEQLAGMSPGSSPSAPNPKKIKKN